LRLNLVTPRCGGHATGLLLLIVLVNIAVWLLALAVFGHNATLMGLFIFCWLASMAYYYLCGYDKLLVEPHR